LYFLKVDISSFNDLQFTSLYICKLFSGIAHVYVDKRQCHYLTTNSFRPTFINQVVVINKDHCSTCSYY